MATGPGFPSGNNTYVKPDISGRLRMGFSRNAKKFHFPKYVQYVETPNMEAYYLKMTAQMAARVVDVEDFEWPDGQPDRLDEDGTESFNFIPFATGRRSYKFRLGDLSTRQAVWPIVEDHSTIAAARCMTARTIRMMTQLLTTSNWATSADPDATANHHDTATSLAGGKLDVGTSTAPYLRKALGKIAALINKDTLGVIDSDPDKFLVLVNPDDAVLIGNSAELHDYLKGSYFARDEIASNAHPNNKYGLPSKIYGYEFLVENAVKVTSRKGGTLSKSHVLTGGNLVVVSKPSSIDGMYGSPSFSTATMFWYQDEMTVETKHEDWDRLTDGRVVENTKEVVTAPVSGYLITSATA